MSSENYSDLKMEIELLKRDISFMTTLFDKMDKLVQKIETQQDNIVDKTNTLIEKRIDCAKIEFSELQDALEKTELTITTRIKDIEQLLYEKIDAVNIELRTHVNNEESLGKRVNRIIYIGSGVGIFLLWAIENLDIIKKIIS